MEVCSNCELEIPFLTSVKSIGIFFDNKHAKKIKDRLTDGYDTDEFFLEL